MRLSVIAAIAAICASPIWAAEFVERNLGVGTAATSLVIEFASHDQVTFNYAYTPDANDPFTGRELLEAVQAATAGTEAALTIKVIESSWGAYVDGITYGTWSNSGFIPPDGYWHYWTRESESSAWAYSEVGDASREIGATSQDAWTFSDAAPVPEPTALAALALGGLALLRRRRVMAVACATGALALSPVASQAAVGVSVVPGTLTQGSVRATLDAGTTYANEGNSLADFPLTTGTFGGTTYPITLTNANYNSGVAPATMIAFGNGGGVTLKFAQPVRAIDGVKEFGLFTAQMLLSSSGSLFNGNMEASILVSADQVTWRTLGGAVVANPTTYTDGSLRLNTPTLAYDYGTTATAWSYGDGTAAANLAALGAADYTTPVLNDSLFNSSSATSTQRLALRNDTTTATYDALFGNSAGGNWFDLSASGLPEVSYLRLNGVNMPT
ncbi:MAG TPA: PEP-CTERM sorting domain-containing protein, partial [Tepidisphaeraceae bacterium]